MKTRSVRTRKPLLLKANEQYCLDFGQKIDPIRCATCGMLYVVGEESDEKQHAKYHAQFDEGIRWSVKLERPKKYFDDGCRVIQIIADDQKQVIEAVNKLLKISEGDMSAGCDVSKLVSSKENTLFLIYVNQTNFIVGYVCVEIIKEAYDLIDFDSSRLCSEPSPAECGVLYLWVHPSHRRQNIGTKLMDIARANLKQDKIIFRSRVAVCDPTEVAIPFFNTYLLNKRPVKVYQK